MKGREIEISILSLAALLLNVIKGQKEASVGFEHPEYSYRQFMARLNRRVRVPIELVDAALYTSRLLKQKDKFEHPLDYSFAQLVLDIETKGNVKLNYKWNFLEEKKND